MDKQGVLLSAELALLAKPPTVVASNLADLHQLQQCAHKLIDVEKVHSCTSAAAEVACKAAQR